MGIFNKPFSKSAEYWERKGDESLKDWSFDEAIVFYKKALEQDPANATILFKKGEAFNKDMKYFDAQKTFEKCIEIEPDNLVFRERKGEVLKAQERYQEALMWYELMITDDIENQVSWRANKALCLKDMDCNEDALAYLDEWLEESPSEDIAYYLKALVYHDQEQYEQAVEFYDKAYELNGEAKDAAFGNKIACLEKMGSVDEALTGIDKLIESEPDNSSRHDEKGHLLLDSGMYSEALSCFTKALELIPPAERKDSFIAAGYLCYMGDCHYKLGHFDDAVNAYTQAANANGLTAMAHMSAKPDFELRKMGWPGIPMG